MKISEFIEILKLAFDSMRQNKLRSFLASLGVVIGISFVIIMGWILVGLDSVLEDTINTLGSDMLYVDKWEWAGGRNHRDLRQRKNITRLQAYQLCDRLKTAEVAIPISRKFGSLVKYENESLSNIGIQGTKSEYGLTAGGEIIEGRFFSKTEEQLGSKVGVIGFGLLSSLFKDQDPIGKEIKISGNKITVIGVVKKQGTLLMDFIDNQVYLPMPTFLGMFGNFKRSFTVAIKAGNIENLDNVREETIGAMREIRNLQPSDENDFSVNETKAFEASVATFRLYVYGIGIGMTILSFIVGIIGIMNIMFVSVAERTKEIGIRKAIGAKKRSILTQFIIESAVLCLIGAIFSFIGCSILIFAIATVIPMLVPEITFLSKFLPVNLLIISSFVSIFVGVLAGFIPAVRASNLDPVDALRFE